MVAYFASDGQSSEAVINIEEYEGVFFQIIEGGHNWKYMVNKDETTLFHTSNQRETHTWLIQFLEDNCRNLLVYRA